MRRRQESATLPEPAARRRALALLLSGLVLLQTLWVAHHLASERHLTVAGMLAGTFGGAADGGAGAGCRAHDEGPHAPHLAIDHEVVRERCAEAPRPLGPVGVALPVDPPFAVHRDTRGVWIAPPTMGPPKAAGPRRTTCPRAPPRA